jgi:predicted exporter
LAPLTLGHLTWVNDLSRLTRFDPALQAEDRRVRERISQFDTGRLVIGLAADDDAALALDERIQRALARSIAAGQLDGARSLQSLLWTPTRQLANRAALLRQPDLASRVEAAYVAEGFRPGALRPFEQALDTEPPPPLSLADLRESPLRDLVSTLVLPLGDEVGVLTYLRGVRDPAGIASALEGLPGVHLFDQRTFVDEIYAEFRASTLRQILVGSALVVVALLVRYRRLRPAMAAFLPSALVALLLLEAFAAFGVETNLFHVISLVMVMGMGVDYGVFVVDAAGRDDDPGATLLSLLVASLTTVFVFGTLALSEQPALRAIGVTTGAGILLSLALAPLARAMLPARRGA